jgi:putative ABC transport system substrate-binding protein
VDLEHSTPLTPLLSRDALDLIRRPPHHPAMDRRRFLLTSVAGALAAPLAARAQAGKVYRIGVLDPTPVAQNVANLDGFLQGMRELGYTEGRNFVIEYRSPEGPAKRFSDQARELVRLKVDLILTRGTPAVTAAKNATRTIPIVMAASGDPVGAGVVTELARPGGNVTGLSALTAEVSGKRLQLLKEAVPGAHRFAAVLDRASPGTAWLEMERAARSMGLQPEVLYVEKAEDLATAFDAAVKRRADAVLVGLGPVIQNNVDRVVELAARHRLPSGFFSREFVVVGGLMAYGVSYPHSYRRAASYVDKIFKGAKPGDLPIEQPTKFELVINLKTAKTLGLTIPPALLARADQVIE